MPQGFLPAPLFWEVIPFDLALASTRPRNGCVGHFFDEATRRPVTFNMGAVWVRQVSAFRPVPSQGVNLLPFVGIEGAGQSVGESCSVSTTATKSTTVDVTVTE